MSKFRMMATSQHTAEHANTDWLELHIFKDESHKDSPMSESDESTKPSVERLVAQDIERTVWLRLRRLTSSRLCRQIISRTSTPSPEVLAAKAEGMAWAVRSALGYWESRPADLNARILTRYYALLQVSIAEQVASPDPSFDLNQVQRHTEQGHGLTTLSEPGADFPASYHVGAMKSGHFYSYCAYRRIDLKPYAFEKRPREWAKLNSTDRERLVSLADLLRRVPELGPMVEECLGVQPLSFHVGYATRNAQIRSQKMRETVFTGQPAQALNAASSDETTYVAIYPHSERLTAAYLNSLGLPIQNITVEHDAPTKSDYFIGTFTHPVGGYWWEYLETYKSGCCGTSIIVPLWGGISDLFLIHLVILYSLSIVVRYLPSLWHEIADGDLDHIRALIEHYVAAVDSVLPRIAVERMTGIRLNVTQPGSLGAPV
jgi:hypothetical protein